jgi:transposase
MDPNFFTVDDFTYDGIKNTLTCPAGNLALHYRKAVYHCKDQKRKGLVFEFNSEQCHHCELKPQSNNAKGGRAVYIAHYESFFRQMKERLTSKAGKEAYKQRYKIEHKIADLARYCGMRHCRYRGLKRAGIHTLLAAMASNVKRMVRLLCPKEEKPPELAAVDC